MYIVHVEIVNSSYAALILDRTAIVVTFCASRR